MRPEKSPTQVELELEALEKRLVGRPHEILGIAPEASNSEACAAFVAMSKDFHPRRFADFEPPIVRRAGLLYRHLRHALSQFTAARRDDAEAQAITRKFQPLRKQSES